MKTKQKKIFKALCLLIILTIFMSCKKWFNDWGSAPKPPFKVFSFKEGFVYNDNVHIKLSDDKTRILAFYSPVKGCKDPYSPQCPIKHDSVYYLSRMITENTVFLDITHEEYKEMLPGDSMMALIIDKDPFDELYIDDERVLEISPGMYDTSKLSKLIKNNELDEYLERVK